MAIGECDDGKFVLSDTSDDAAKLDQESNLKQVHFIQTKKEKQKYKTD